MYLDYYVQLLCDFMDRHLQRFYQSDFEMCTYLHRFLTPIYEVYFPYGHLTPDQRKIDNCSNKKIKTEWSCGQFVRHLMCLLDT